MSVQAVLAAGWLFTRAANTVLAVLTASGMMLPGPDYFACRFHKWSALSQLRKLSCCHEAHTESSRWPNKISSSNPCCWSHRRALCNRAVTKRTLHRRSLSPRVSRVNRSRCVQMQSPHVPELRPQQRVWPRRPPALPQTSGRCCDQTLESTRQERTCCHRHPDQ
jgi:hypothetical protein